MKKILFSLAPIAMLTLVACNKSETAQDAKDDPASAAQTAAPIDLPPSITASATYRCADNTILYIDFLGNNIAADIRVTDKTATAIRVSAAAPADAAAPAAEAASAGPLKSADGETLLTGSGKQINVKLPGKGAQTCKS